ncbi:MAG: DUF1570 domain-containing protein [Planctomycetota bacterium]
MRRAAVALWCSAVGLAAQAPHGFKTYENKLAPLTFHYPVAYKEVPLPPTEQLRVAHFVMDNDKRPRELKKFDDRLFAAATPFLDVFEFEDTSAPVTGAPEEKAEEAGPATVREAMEARSKVSSWEEFEKRLPAFQFVLDAKDDDAFTLRYRGRSPGAGMNLVGRLQRKREGNRVMGVYAISFEPHLDALTKIVSQVHKSLEPSDEDSGGLDAARLERLYQSGKYGAVEWRIKARMQLAKGWKAVDTDNYLIVHHTRRPGLVQNIAREIEAMRAFYSELFPADAPIDRVSVVRLCETLAEYKQYGGPPNTGGYWHPGNEELVLFDYRETQKGLSDQQKEAMGKRKLSDADSFLVLYHEAFHQYIHYAVGEFSPHDWFNEGYGDYFSGAVVSRNTGRVLRIDPSPWRIHRAKDQCEFGKGFLSLKQVLSAERAQFYNKSHIADYYAAAWSFIYFLKHSDEVAKHPRWSKLLDDYFQCVKRCYKEQLATAGDSPDLRQKQVASFEARKKALAETLQGIDLDELQAVWKKFVIDMKDPWPNLRKKGD